MLFTATRPVENVGVCLSVQVRTFLQRFRLSVQQLQEVSARLEEDLSRGLGKHTHHEAPVKMLPTFVRATPDGSGNTSLSDMGQDVEPGPDWPVFWFSRQNAATSWPWISEEPTSEYFTSKCGRKSRRRRVRSAPSLRK